MLFKISKCRTIVFFIKISISLMFVLWTIKSGMLNFNNITKGLIDTKLTFLFFILTFIQLILATLRTYDLLLEKKILIKKFLRLLYINWSASFICNFAPLSSIGDFYRIKELMNKQISQTRDIGFYSAIYAKLFSLLSLFIISAVSAFFLSSEIVNRNLVLMVVGFVFLSMYGIILMWNRLSKLILFFLNIITPSKYRGFLVLRLEHLHEYNLFLVKEKATLFRIFGYSLCLQILNVFSFLIIVIFLNREMDIEIFNMLYLIPFGLLIMMFPISLNGLGVGHIAFSNILAFAGIQNGADVFTIFFAFSYIFNFIGGYFFFSILFSKNRKVISNNLKNEMTV